MRVRMVSAAALFLLVFSLVGPVRAAPMLQEDAPQSVTVAGTLQSELGCDSDWMPSCEKTFLEYDPEDGVWQGSFPVAPGDDQDKRGSRYKAALNGGWDWNYGKNAQPGGADIPLVVETAREVKFYYHPITHWITDNVNTPILVAVGNFQTQLGCARDNDASCLRSWLQDPEGSGTYSFTTRDLKRGEYTFVLARNEDPADLLGEMRSFTVANDGDEIYFGYDPVKKETLISTTGAPRGSLAKLKAVWINQDTILWKIVGSARYRYSLFYSPQAALALTSAGVEGGEEIALTFSSSGPGGDVFKENPYLAGWSAFKIAPADFGRLKDALKGQLAVVARSDQGKVVDATGVQTGGALDALYSYNGPLGVAFEGQSPVLRLWAPTAQSVRLLLYPDSSSAQQESIEMREDPETGVWSAAGRPDWTGRYYLYEVKVYVPSTGKIETNRVTDPYSFSLSTNSLRSQIVNLEDAALKPQGWDRLSKPPLARFEDIVLYELHIRDFSISDASVPADLRGTYLAFSLPASDGMRHLQALAQAGLTHVHLLPAFDIASVDEDKTTWKSVDEAALAQMPPDSSRQAEAVMAVKGQDGFNWGYDPYHFTVPEGSYATDPNGPRRILEFREMIAGLNRGGLRVVMDVVYNHTSESGQNPKSVLDKIVPGYYYRLNAEGRVETSTCCQNTASERRMMEKLMVDSLLVWAREYKVDGFRFDLMGHHMLRNMQAVRAALDGLTLQKDGVDGKKIYIYGEGWNFGEVANNARGVNATQLNIGGTGIGAFNDRIRDGARGGTPFGDPREQGFATGLFFAPNAAEGRDSAIQRSELADAVDWIRVGLAGGLKSYPIRRANGDIVSGERILYNGSGAGYTLDPQENILYVSAHDNETIFDAVQVKASADTPLAERIRMNNLALSLVMFGQGVPFFHAGDDLLRSKSLDRNSYDSGDWFNRLDWTMQTNNWGVGLPVDAGNKAEIFAPLLADPALKPGPADIAFSAAVFQENLRIRKSSPLFRLSTAAQIEAMLTFLNTGPDQVPGLIVMRITDTENLDSRYREIVVLFNAAPEAVAFRDPALTGNYRLHPLQVESADTRLREAGYTPESGFNVPGRSAAVFVLPDSPPVGVVLGGTAVLAALAGGAALLSRRKKK